MATKATTGFEKSTLKPVCTRRQEIHSFILWILVIRPEEFLPADPPILKVNCLSSLLCLIVYLVIIRFRPN